MTIAWLSQTNNSEPPTNPHIRHDFMALPAVTPVCDCLLHRNHRKSHTEIKLREVKNTKTKHQTPNILLFH